MSLALFRTGSPCFVADHFFAPGVIAIPPSTAPSRTWEPLNEAAALSLRALGVLTPVGALSRSDRIQYPTKAGEADRENTMLGHAMQSPKRPPV